MAPARREQYHPLSFHSSVLKIFVDDKDGPRYLSTRRMYPYLYKGGTLLLCSGRGFCVCMLI